MPMIRNDNVLIQRFGWSSLLIIATIAGSFVFACATPFPALGALAALFLPRRDAESGESTARARGAEASGAAPTGRAVFPLQTAHAGAAAAAVPSSAVRSGGGAGSGAARWIARAGEGRWKANVAARRRAAKTITIKSSEEDYGQTKNAIFQSLLVSVSFDGPAAGAWCGRCH